MWIYDNAGSYVPKYAYSVLCPGAACWPAHVTVSTTTMIGGTVLIEAQPMELSLV